VPIAKLSVDGAVVKVEIEGASGQRQAGMAEDMTARFEDAMSIVQKLATQFTQSLQAFSREHQPREASMTFGLKISGEANWVVAKAGGESTFQVTLRWEPAHQSTNRVPGGEP
jgi:hypothetical protein